jgi:hypothetical protein
MNTAKSYSPGVRERSVRMALEQQKDRPSQGEIELIVQLWIGK